MYVLQIKGSCRAQRLINLWPNPGQCAGSSHTARSVREEVYDHINSDKTDTHIVNTNSFSNIGI